MNRSRSLDVFKNIRTARRDIWEIAALAVAVSLSVNLISSAIFDAWHPIISITLGATVILACLIYFVLTKTRDRKFSAEFNALFAVEKKNPEKVVPIPGYRFGEEFASIIASVFGENEALKRQWVNEPPSSAHQPDGDRCRIVNVASVRLAREAAEYLLLEELSTHLTDYFNTDDLSASKVKELTRDDLPDVLLRNRVLEMLSRDMADRPGFPIEQGMLQKSTLVLYGHLRYSRFDLSLPIDSTIQRTSTGALVVDSPAMRIELSTICDGYSGSLPGDFAVLVMHAPAHSICTYRVVFKLEVHIKKPLIMSRSAWLYHEWLESFAEKLDRRFDANTFLHDINWQSSRILLRALFRPPKRSQAEKSDEKATIAITKMNTERTS